MKNKLLSSNKSDFIAGIFDYRIFFKKAIRENIENGFFDTIVKSVEFYSDEIVALFTCLRLEIYIYSDDKDKLNNIRNIFLKNKFKVLLGKEELIEHLNRLYSGQLSEIIAELQIEKQITNAFESQLKGKAKLIEIYQNASRKAALFRKKKNFYNNENYASIAFKIIMDLTDQRSKKLLIVGAGMMSEEFAKTYCGYREKFNKFFIVDPDRQKSKKLKNILGDDNVEIIDIPEINNTIKMVNVIFVAAGGKYKIHKRMAPLLIVDITCPPMFSIEKCQGTRIITMYDEIYKTKINQVNNAFKDKLK